MSEPSDFSDDFESKTEKKAPTETKKSDTKAEYSDDSDFADEFEQKLDDAVHFLKKKNQVQTKSNGSYLTTTSKGKLVPAHKSYTTAMSKDQLKAWTTMFGLTKAAKKAKKQSLKRTKELAKPKETSRTEKCTCVGKKRTKCSKYAPMPGCARNKVLFSKEDDGLECTFNPTLSRKSKSLAAKAVNGVGFVERMEADNESHKTKLEKTIQEEDYSAKLDQLVCPKCHRNQSFQEYNSKIKKCQDCHAFFRPKKSWLDVKESFLNRLDESMKKKEQFLKKERKPQKLTTLKWDDVKDSFLARMDEDFKKRELKAKN
eukprot:TRINITY_DN774466_c0_g1_i1.p1 TRINITY_DN774466_c0_g1~~TRINITY_DN774466_c0_g1_i1.p1  ORF type:complete len:334 (-),score=105.05 TRINITY_DN774466_c0_g1_i1:220-1164(-)